MKTNNNKKKHTKKRKGYRIQACFSHCVQCGVDSVYPFVFFCSCCYFCVFLLFLVCSFLVLLFLFFFCLFLVFLFLVFFLICCFLLLLCFLILVLVLDFCVFLCDVWVVSPLLMRSNWRNFILVSTRAQVSSERNGLPLLRAPRGNAYFAALRINSVACAYYSVIWFFSFVFVVFFFVLCFLLSILFIFSLL